MCACVCVCVCVCMCVCEKESCSLIITHTQTCRHVHKCRPTIIKLLKLQEEVCRENHHQNVSWRTYVFVIYDLVIDRSLTPISYSDILLTNLIVLIWGLWVDIKLYWVNSKGWDLSHPAGWMSNLLYIPMLGLKEFPHQMFLTYLRSPSALWNKVGWEAIKRKLDYKKCCWGPKMRILWGL